MTVVDETTGPLIVEEDAPPAGGRLAGLADALYVTGAGGFMHGRLLRPALAVMMPVAVVDARSWWGAVRIVGVVPWAVTCGTHLRVPYVDPDGIADERGSEPGGSLGWRTDRAHPVHTSMKLRRDVAARDAFVASYVRITGLLAGPSERIVDPSGLADLFASRMLVQTRGRPGHEKALPFAWVIARFGCADVLLPDGISAEDVDDARRTLRCGALHHLEAATTAPLTPARFVRNMRLAIQLRDFRFPSDPSAALARFCAG